MDSCTGSERILSALRREEPDRVPYHEPAVSAPIIEAFCGRTLSPEGTGGIAEMDARGSMEELTIARALHRDHVTFRAVPPVPVDLENGSDGIAYYTRGHIASVKDLERIELPDPGGDAFWEGAAPLVEEARAEGLATCLTTRVGISPVYLAMGTENFAIALYDDPTLVEAILERYTDWAVRVMRHSAGRGFDYVMTADDLAFKNGPLMSPDMFRRIFLPYARKVADAIELPWVFHSDGDVSPLIADLVDLGVAGLNPIEPEAMDIERVKKEWGDHLCLVGNVSVHLLAAGTPDAVAGEVRRLLRTVAPGGGYLLSSGNSLASYCKPENVRAMIDTLDRYGSYPIAAGV